MTSRPIDRASFQRADARRRGAREVRDDARPLPELLAPRPTDPLHPRPPEIRELEPLAHGLRHIAFLLATDADGAVAAALGPRATAALQTLQPAVAGELPATPPPISDRSAREVGTPP